MTMIQIIGFVALATGATFLAFAYNSTNAPMEQLSNTLTGRYSSETMWYFAVGMAAVVGGGLFAAFGVRK